MTPLVADATTRPRFDLAVAGHLNLDHLIEVPDLPARDRTVPVRRRRTVLGGTAANLALAASQWGVRSALISRAGADLPRGFLTDLARRGVDVRGVEKVAGVASSACFIVHDAKGGQVTLIDQGAMDDAGRGAVPERVLRECGWLHLGTGHPRWIARLEAWARTHRLPVAVDPAQEIHYRWDADSLHGLLEGAEIFFGNESEVEEAVSLLKVGSADELTHLVPLVVMTRGRRGARAYFRGGRVDVPAARLARVADPTGAGDAFRGGFYAGWFAGQPLERCLIAGQRSAYRWLMERARPSSRGSHR